MTRVVSRTVTFDGIEVKEDLSNDNACIQKHNDTQNNLHWAALQILYQLLALAGGRGVWRGVGGFMGVVWVVGGGLGG